MPPGHLPGLPDSADLLGESRIGVDDRSSLGAEGRAHMGEFATGHVVPTPAFALRSEQTQVGGSDEVR